MPNLPDLRVKYLGSGLKYLYVDNTDLTREKRYTFLTDAVNSASTTIRVQTLIGFESVNTSSGQIVCIGEIGDQFSEIVRTSNTAPISSYTYGELTLRDTLVQNHPQDTKVFILDWNRIDFQYATTYTGAKSTLVASPSYPVPIQASLPETVYRETTQNNVFYFARFNESVGGTNSDYSDGVYSTGFDDNSVAAIEKRATDNLGVMIDGNKITHEYLHESLWEARREYHDSPGKRPFRRIYDFAAATALTGSLRIEVPANCEDPASGDNIYGVRIGQSPNLTYYDKKSWDADFVNIPFTYLTSAYTIGARDLYVNDARNFAAPSGAVSVEESIISYSDISFTGNTLRISADGKWNASSGSTVYQNASYGLPYKFTVWQDPKPTTASTAAAVDLAGSAWIYFNMPIDTAFINQIIYLDYYRTLPGISSDASILDEPEYDMYVYYLMAKIKHRLAKGDFDITKDPDYLLYKAKLANALGNERLGADIRLAPNVNHLPIPQ